jgi:5-formyltetrahydrofolate cyclo-ligase
MASAESASILNQKRSLRRAMDNRRTNLPAAERDRASREACERLVNLPELREVAARGGCVAGFVAVRSELDPSPALSEARRRGARVAFPRVADDARPRLRFHVATEADLRPGRFGIPAPEAGEAEVALQDIDLMLVPGLAFDADGRRLGFGGGYYDEVLAAARPCVVGVGYDFQVVDTCPVEAQDQRVDCVVTDARVLRAPSPTSGGEVSP